MKTNPSDAVKMQLEKCIAEMKSLINELEPSDRLLFVNELFVRLMPDRKSADSAREKLLRKHKNPLQGLSKAQMNLVKKISDDTDRLFDMDGDNRA